MSRRKNHFEGATEKDLGEFGKPKSFLNIAVTFFGDMWRLIFDRRDPIIPRHRGGGHE